MAKQNVTMVRKVAGPIETATTKSGKAKTTTNADGFAAFKRTPKSDLFLLALGRFFGESSYYEKDATQRFVELVHKVTKSDPEWVAAFLRYLRHDANIRTSAIVGAVEYVRAGGPNGRTVVRSVISRGDEPAEMLAYFINNYGKRIPQPIKRGIADSASRLYTERNYARWDSASSAVRFADVVELTHPRPETNWQSDLFRYAIESRHGRGSFEGKVLPSLLARSQCKTRADWLDQLEAGNPTVSWENVSSAGGGSMTAAEWLACFEHMGYMAKLRNLRNLDNAGVSVKDKRRIGEALADPEAVAKSRQLPMRFLSAYKAVKNDVWASYLAEALDNSLVNVPKVKGKWLVLVDASGSMNARLSDKSELSYYEAATVFAAAFAKANNATIRTYSGSLSPVYGLDKAKSTLQIVNDLAQRKFWFGGGTSTAPCLAKAFKEGDFDHVLLLTDEQYNWGGSPSASVPKSVPLYTFNLAGYRASQSEMDLNRVTIGGLNDSAFTMIATIEDLKNKWPWE
jgi:TROVE domain